MNKFLLIFIFQSLFTVTYSQVIKKGDGEKIINKVIYSEPQIPGIRKSKGVEFNYQTIPNYEINSFTEDTSYTGRIDNDTKIEVKLKVPVVLKKSIKVIVGFKYSYERLNFKGEASKMNELYSSLNGKKLRSYRSSLNVSKSFIGNKYLIARASFRLTGDFKRNQLIDYFRSSLSVVYGVRANENLSWGLGLTHSYSFGRQLVFPVLAYSRKLNNKWSINALLPVNARLGYKINEKNTLEFTTAVSGDSYNIDVDDFGPNDLFLERSNLLTKLTFEREIYDFLWFGLSVGGRYNVAFDLSEKNTFLNRDQPQVTNNIKPAMLYQASIFLVPPRKLRSKLSEEKYETD